MTTINYYITGVWRSGEPFRGISLSTLKDARRELRWWTKHYGPKSIVKSVKSLRIIKVTKSTKVILKRSFK